MKKKYNLNDIIKTQMEEMINTLNSATEEYNKGTPIMSDKEWDDLFFKLLKLEGQYQPLKHSPTQTLHYPSIVEGLEKATHDHPMLSLKKTKDLDEVANFVKEQFFIAMLKLDGLTCSLTYENGKLIKAETRGNGYEGENVLHIISQILNVPKYILITDKLVVDGEIICPTDTFFEEFSKDYKNPRNYAAGALRRLEADSNSGLKFIAWDCIEGLSISDLSGALLILEDLGFEVVPFVERPVIGTWSGKDILDIVNELQQMATDFSYPIDGMVFKYDVREYYKSLGMTEHHFRGGLAYKFYDETEETTLKYIDWTMGRTGILTPVAVFEPIELEGTEVSRASLHNVSIMREIMGDCCYAGQKIQIFKANQIIPQVYSAVKMSYGDVIAAGGVSVDGFSKEMICPVCGGETALEESESGTINLVCQNPQCEGKLVNRLEHFCSKKGLDIKGLSKKTLEKLVDWGVVNNYEDIFDLKWHQKSLALKPGFGEKSVEKLCDSIDAARNTTLNKVISAAGIPLIGTTIAKDLAKRFKTYSSFRRAIDSGFQFYSLPNYGYEMHNALTSFNYEELDYIVECFLNIEEEKEEVLENTSLKNKVFVITGKLTHFKNRNEIKDKIETLGGKVSGSVTKNTNYLINNDIESTTAKNKTAKTLGVPIITEEDFIKIFDI